MYILDMLDIPVEIKAAFDAGEFAICQKTGIFNGVWSDMATEKTIIKDSKGNGGIVGLTRKKSALVRWTLTRHVLSIFGSEMRERSGLVTDCAEFHQETKPAAMQRDDQKVTDLIDHIVNKMTDPFDVALHPTPLINISTGMHASREVQESLLNCVEEGTKMVKSFVDSSLSKGKFRSFYNPITRSKLKSLEDMTQKTKLKCRSGDTVTVHINPELVFRRTRVLANCREDVTVEKVLSFPIGPIPTSLFHDDGTMRKASKADLAHQLEQDVSIIQTLAWLCCSQ